MFNFLQKIKNKKLLSNIFNIIALSFVFVGGVFSKSTRFEEIADYATQVVINNTENQKYCAITVEKGKNSNDLYNADSEFHNLYGVFRQEKVTFASAINADKKHDISIENITGNLSMFYFGTIGSYEYKGHYRHTTFPLEFMFDEKDTYSVGRYHVYLSQKQADQYLSSKIGEKANGYSSEDYESLISTLIPVKIDNQTFDFVIQNIYYNHNYYYDGLTEVMNDFIGINYYLPLDLRSEQKHMYFMSEYTYQNRYFMNYINENYNSKEYVVKVLHNNIVDVIDDKYLLSFYYSDQIANFDWLFVVCIIISVILYTISLILMFELNIENKYDSKTFVLQMVLLFVPYLIFHLLSLVLHNNFLMSAISTKINGILVFIYFLICLILHYVAKNKISFKKKEDGEHYEINI